ncbi:MAG: phage portal protein [Leifsonia sp.]
MSFRTWLTGQAVEERAAPNAPEEPNVPARRGYEFGIAREGTEAPLQAMRSGDRGAHLEELYELYLNVPWVSTCVDTIARTITAGGLTIVADKSPAEDDAPEPEVAPAEPPAVARLRQLIAFCNPREDMIQLTRSLISDILVFGDAFAEFTWLLGEPVAVYTLDATTMSVVADGHGQVLRYEQRISALDEPVIFQPHEVIHISLDSPRGGLYGVSPTDKLMLSILTWMFNQACMKEHARKGYPRHLHIDQKNLRDEELDKSRNQYMARNVGIKNIGQPIMSRNGGTVNEFGQAKVVEMLEVSRQSRDEIVAGYGVPPAAAGIIEHTALGGGKDEAQDKRFKYNTCAPIAALLLEKLNYSLVQQGFGIVGWHLELDEVDMRDSKTVEDIRELRIKNGTYTLNRARGEIGEPPVEGGDDAVLVTRTGVTLWSDIEAMSAADLEAQQTPKAVVLSPSTPPASGAPSATDAAGPTSARESAGPSADLRAVDEAWFRAYRHRRKKALADLSADD